MRTDHPSPRHIPQMRRLWQDAFGDEDAFLDLFFESAYSPDRSLCILQEDRVISILYWFDTWLEDRKLAYLYAVVTHPDYRGRGLFHRLLEDTCSLLLSRGYAGILLVPQSSALRLFYRKLGFRNVGGLDLLECTIGDRALPLQRLEAEDYARLRRQMLPAGAVIQEGVCLDFLARQFQLFSGPGCLLAAYAQDGILHVPELLGDAAAAPGILKALGFPRGRFRMPGVSHPFAMFRPLTDCPAPAYFGFAFD